MTVVIPAFKPDEKLPALIRHLQEQTNTKILVVNDGSGSEFDPVFKEVSRLGARLLVHAENRGKGAALKTAFSHLLKTLCETEVIACADADGQHLPEDIFRCLEEAEKHPGTLILGARSFRGEVPFRSRFGNAASRLTFHLLMGKRVYDTQTGLRAFSSDLLEELLAVKGDRYEYEMQMLCDFARKKIPMREIEIETVYIEENRSSHFHVLRDAGRVYGILLKNAVARLFEFFCFLASSCASFLVDTALYWIGFRILFPLFFASTARIAFASLLLARCLSSLTNFFINRKLVFRSRENPAKTLVLYLVLALAVFFLNHELNTFFLITLGQHELLSLLLAQCISFPVSYFAQKFIVFPKKKRKNK